MLIKLLSSDLHRFNLTNFCREKMKYDHYYNFYLQTLARSEEIFFNIIIKRVAY